MLAKTLVNRGYSFHNFALCNKNIYNALRTHSPKFITGQCPSFVYEQYASKLQAATSLEARNKILRILSPEMLAGQAWLQRFMQKKYIRSDGLILVWRGRLTQLLPLTMSHEWKTDIKNAQIAFMLTGYVPAEYESKRRIPRPKGFQNHRTLVSQQGFYYSVFDNSGNTTTIHHYEDQRLSADVPSDLLNPPKKNLLIDHWGDKLHVARLDSQRQVPRVTWYAEGTRRLITCSSSNEAVLSMHFLRYKKAASLALLVYDRKSRDLQFAIHQATGRVFKKRFFLSLGTLRSKHSICDASGLIAALLWKTRLSLIRIGSKVHTNCLALEKIPSQSKIKVQLFRFNQDRLFLFAYFGKQLNVYLMPAPSGWQVKVKKLAPLWTHQFKGNIALFKVILFYKRPVLLVRHNEESGKLYSVFDFISESSQQP